MFGRDTGLSLDGIVLLNSGEVRHNWLDVSSLDFSIKMYFYFLHKLDKLTYYIKTYLTNICMV